MKKYLSILCVLSVFSLQGCVGAFVAGAATGAAVINDKRNIQTMSEDQGIKQKANSKLFNNKEMREDTHIVVSSYNRIVLVAGQAPSKELKARAVDIVNSVPNIRQVYDEVTIEKPTTLKQRADDTWITTKVKSEMLTHDGLKAVRVKVITDNNTVYLMGIVTRKQGDLAAEVSRKVPGVKRVVKVFEYETA